MHRLADGVSPDPIRDDVPRGRTGVSATDLAAVIVAACSVVAVVLLAVAWWRSCARCGPCVRRRRAAHRTVPVSTTCADTSKRQTRSCALDGLVTTAESVTGNGRLGSRLRKAPWPTRSSRAGLRQRHGQRRAACAGARPTTHGTKGREADVQAHVLVHHRRHRRVRWCDVGARRCAHGARFAPEQVQAEVTTSFASPGRDLRGAVSEVRTSRPTARRSCARSCLRGAGPARSRRRSQRRPRPFRSRPRWSHHRPRGPDGGPLVDGPPRAGGRNRRSANPHATTRLTAPMAPQTSAELRRAWTDFFVARQHTRVPSGSLIPTHPSAPMFTNSGMMPFVPYFLGEEAVPYEPPRAVSVQRCVRAGGKHNDLDAIGRSTRHLSFFEMLGNFIFGDTSRPTPRVAWSSSPEVLELDPERLCGDGARERRRAEALWVDRGLPPQRIQRLGKELLGDGETGPWVRRRDLWTTGRNGPEGGPANPEAENRYVEIWKPGVPAVPRVHVQLSDLPPRTSTPAAGLDRIMSVLAGVPTSSRPTRSPRWSTSPGRSPAPPRRVEVATSRCA